MIARTLFLSASVLGQRKYRRSLKGVVNTMYAGMAKRVKNPQRKHFGLPVMEKRVFVAFAMNSPVLKRLQEAHAKNGFDPKMSPTVDRIDNKKGYVLGNIQFLPRGENVSKFYRSDYDGSSWPARSKYRWVAFDAQRPRKPWMAGFYWKGKKVYIGRFTNEEDAGIAADVAHQILFNHPSHLSA